MAANLQTNLVSSDNICLSNIEQTKAPALPIMLGSFAFFIPGRTHRTENLHHRAMTRLGFDIFRKMEDGHPLWIAEVAILEKAKTHLHELASRAPGEYFIRDASNGQIIFEFVSPR
jgi:hypothetical protein